MARDSASHRGVFFLQITLPSYIQATTTAVPSPATAEPRAIISAHQTAEELPAAADHHSSPCIHPGNQPHDANADETLATKHALLQPHKRPSESEDVHAAPESVCAVSANQSRGAVEAGPDQRLASSSLLHVQHQNRVLGADHTWHASSSNGNEAMGSALGLELALPGGSSPLSKACDDRSNPDWRSIVDAPHKDFTDLHFLDEHTHQDCAGTDMLDRHAKVCQHDLLDNTAAAASPLMTNDKEHVFSTTAADHNPAVADERDAGTSCCSWGLQMTHSSSKPAAQVTLLLGKSQQNLVGPSDHWLLCEPLPLVSFVVVASTWHATMVQEECLGPGKSAICIQQLGPQQN